MPEFWAHLGSAPSKSSSLHAAWIASPPFMLLAYLVGEESSTLPRCSNWYYASLVEDLTFSSGTIQVKCALDGGMDPSDLTICNHLIFHLQRGGFLGLQVNGFMVFPDNIGGR